MVDRSVMYRCKYCVFVSLEWKILLKHSFEAHSALPGFSFSCHINGCVQTFTKYKSILSHISRQHEGLSQVEDNSITTEPEDHVMAVNSSNSDDYMDVVNELGCNEDEGSSQQSQESAANNAVDLTSAATTTTEKTAALFILSLKEQHRVTQTGIDFTVDQVQNLISMSINDVKSALKRKLYHKSNLIPSDIDEAFDFSNPFLNLQTPYMQKKYFKENFNSVSCKIIIIITITLNIGTSHHYSWNINCCNRCWNISEVWYSM